MAHHPPVPPDQQGRRRKTAPSELETDLGVGHDPAGGNAKTNLREQGRFGNVNQNTHNKGHQQDR